MDDTAIKESTTTPQVDIALMINEAVDRITIVVEEKLVAFENRIETKFISRAEFDELRNRFNTFPQKPAASDEVHELRRQLDRVEAEKQILSTQVTTLMGGHSENRASILNMREHQAQVDLERANLATVLNLAISSFNQTRDENKEIKAAQIKYNQELNEVKEDSNRIENRIVDTEARLTGFVTPANDLLFGGHGQPGIQKMFTEVTASIQEFKSEYQQNRAADLEALNFSLTMKRFIIGSIKSVMKPAVLFRILLAIFGTGTIGAFLIQLINGAN